MKKHNIPYRNAKLHIEQVPIHKLAAQFGTPLYAYSYATLKENFLAYENALQGQPHLVCYAVKANGNLAILNALAKLGAGFDIVSRGELERVIAAGGDPKKVIFSGVGKTPSEIEYAANVGIHSFNIESEAELETLIALKIPVNISIRVNPDVDAQTHPYIATGLRESKFGVDIATAKGLYQRAAQHPHLHITGIDCHIGSQITSLTPFLDALERILALIVELREMGIQIQELDMGGGLGIAYENETLPSPADYMQAVRARIAPDLKLVVEPGRSIVAEAGVLITSVVSVKEAPPGNAAEDGDWSDWEKSSGKNFAIVDAAMNDLIRPALYGAKHQVFPVDGKKRETRIYDIVGPVCESSDVLAKSQELGIRQGDLFAIMDTGAYGMSMASNYNARPRPAEVLVDGAQVHLIRKRETYPDLMRGETIP